MAPDPSERDRSERARILDAAYRVLAAGNGRGVSVTDVLEAAGLSTRAFYRHFQSKDALLLALYRRDAERLNAQLDAEVDAAPSPVAALVGWIQGTFSVVADPRRRQRALVFASEEVTRARGILAERHRIQQAQTATIARILAAGQQAGAFRSATLPADAPAIRAVVGEALQEQLSGLADISPTQAAAQVADFALRALGAVRTSGNAVAEGARTIR